MPYSGSFTFTVTQTDVIREGMLNVGAIGENEVPTAQESIDCARKLNMLVKQLAGRSDFAPGLKMWTRQRGALFLGYNQHVYMLGPNGDNWAGGVTGGTALQLYNQTQLISVAPQGATSIQVNSITNINSGDFIGIQFQPSSANAGTDIFWTVIAGAPTGTTVNLVNPLTGSAANSAYVWNYTVKQQRPVEIVTSILRDIYNNDTPQQPLTVQDYEMLPTKTMPGTQSDPRMFYYESQIGTYPNTLTATANIGAGVYYIDCYGANDVTKHMHIVFLREVMDINNPGDNPEYPQQWYRALCWGGAREIAGMFDCTWTQDMQQNYQESMAMAKEQDGETTTFYFEREASSPYDDNR